MVYCKKISKCLILSIVFNIAIFLLNTAVYSQTNIASVSISPESATITVGDSISFTATVLDTSGAPVDTSVTWSVSDTAIGSVNQNGLFISTTAGSVTVIASFGSLSDTSTVTVNAATTPSEGPVITSGPEISKIEEDEVEIKWKTDIKSDSRVEFGVDSTYGSLKTDDELEFDHEIELEDLEPGTLYHFRVGSQDEAGNIVWSTNSTFITVSIFSSDSTAPRITSGPEVEKIFATGAEIEWKTNEKANSMIEYGIDSTYGESTNEEEYTKKHKIKLKELAINTLYHFRTGSSDKNGNTVWSGNFTFTTSAVIDSVAPVISAGPEVDDIGKKTVKIKWETEEETTGIVDYGIDSTYGLVKNDDKFDDEHKVKIQKLTPGTLYHYRVTVVDISGNTFSTGDLRFTTESVAGDTIFPVILSGPAVSKISDESVHIIWDTDEPADSRIEYGTDSLSLDLFKDKDKVDTEHEISVEDLSQGTKYFYRVGSTDEFGNGPVFSSINSFTTETESDDDKPVFLTGPEVNAITSTSAIVNWTTDEPGNSHVLFKGEDSNVFVDSSNSDFVTDHSISLSGLEIDTEYKIRVFSFDPAGNKTEQVSGKFTTLSETDSLPPSITSGPVIEERNNDRIIVEWKTDKAASSFIEFGTDSTLSGFIEEDKLEKKHKIVLANLTPGTTYLFRVGSEDINGNIVTSNIITVTTRLTEDEEEPVIVKGPIVTGLSDNHANVVWETSEPSDTFLKYRADDDSVWTERIKTALTKKHLVSLTNLSPGVKYKYEIKSTDASGNQSEEEDGSFRTITQADTTAPIILAGPVVGDIESNEVEIEWETNEPSTSLIFYGTDSTLSMEYIDTELDDEHEITITNLSPGTQYFYRVGSSDQNRNGPTLSIIRNFTTESAADTTAPVINSGPQPVDITNNSATFEWVTSEPTDSRLEYQLVVPDSQNSEWLEVESGEFVLQHQIVVTNLLSDTLYNYRAISEDKSGLSVVSPSENFRTETSPDVDPPIITNGPTIFITNSTATFSWSTNESSDSYVYVKLTSDSVYAEYGDPEHVFDHNIVVTNLDSSTVYDIVITSTDLAGNTVTTSNVSVKKVSLAKNLSIFNSNAAGFIDRFTTLKDPDLEAPKILSGPSVLNKTTESVTIVWKTDEPSNSIISYDLSDGSLPRVLESLEMTTSHKVTIPNLNKSTRYKFKVSSDDFLNNGPTESLEGAFTTLGSADNTAPVFIIEPVVKYITSNLAVVDWKTDELASVGINYQRIGGVNIVVNSIELTNEHRFYLSNLQATSDYQLFVTVTDQNGNSFTKTAPLEFQTPAALDVNSPLFTKNPEAVYISDKSTIISWSTDEISDSRVLYGLDVSYGNSVSSGKDVLEHFIELTNLVPGTTYHYKITSQDPSNNAGLESTDVTFTTASSPDLTAPEVPVGLKAVTGPDSPNTVSLSWDSNSESDFGGYNIYRKEAAGDFILIASLVQEPEYLDTDVINGIEYFYSISASDKNSIPNESELSASISATPGEITSVDEDILIPNKFELRQNYPNPFNPETIISFNIPKSGNVELKIYNILGQEIRTLVNTEMTAGSHSLKWDGRNKLGNRVGSGLYIYALRSEGKNKSRKMLLIK